MGREATQCDTSAENVAQTKAKKVQDDYITSLGATQLSDVSDQEGPSL